MSKERIKDRNYRKYDYQDLKHLKRERTEYKNYKQKITIEELEDEYDD